MSQANTIGIIGVGNMGGGMARRLLGLGWRVHVRDIDASKTEALRTLGATVQASPAALTAAVEPLPDRALLALQGPESAAVLAALMVTKRPRSAYDHLMLGLHDRAKSDVDYQRGSAQREVRFAPGTMFVNPPMICALIALRRVRRSCPSTSPSPASGMISPQIMRKVVALRKMKPDDRREMDMILDTYKAALGLD